jgi:hypothetical protein
VEELPRAGCACDLDLGLWRGVAFGVRTSCGDMDIGEAQGAAEQAMAAHAVVLFDLYPTTGNPSAS